MKWFRAKQEPIPPKPEIGADELLTTHIAKFRDHMREVEHKIEQAHANEVASAKARIAYAESFVKQTKINESLTNLLGEVWNWPNYDAERTFKYSESICLEDIAVKHVHDGKSLVKQVAFKCNSRGYLFEFKPNSSFDNTEYGSIRLLQNESLVIAIGVARDLSLPYDEPVSHSWHYFKVDFLTIGNWVSDIVEIDERIRVERRKRLLSYEATRLTEHAANLPNNRN